MVRIQIENLSKNFGDYPALKNLNLQIEPGEIFFLLGPSGCGKTTLLRHIAGFYTPDQGKIFFDDEDVTDLPPKDRHTAMMFQSYALWPHKNVAKNVAFGLEQQGVDWQEIEQKVTEALDIVQMRDCAERKINELSGGQQQRVALARALVVRPRCLLLDEPLSNLDAKLRLEMRGEIRRVCKEFGLTAVYVTHDQKEALSIADNMAIMEAGNLLQVGSPLEIYRKPNSLAVATFIGESNLIPGKVTQITEDKYIYVETKEGLFQGLATNDNWNPAMGSKVTLSIRPETIQPTSSPSSLNSLEGVIKDYTYLGELAQYQIQSKQGNAYTCSELNPSATRGNIGDLLYTSIEAKDVIVLGE